MHSSPSEKTRSRDSSSSAGPKSPTGIFAVGVFLFFGALTASLAGVTLVRRGTKLDRIWELNPTAYAQLAPFRSRAGVLFLLLGGSLALAGVGWFKRRAWGWRLAVAIISIQVLGDVITVSTGDLAKGSVGFAIASILLIYLLRPKVRRFVSSSKATVSPSPISALRAD
jgi:hypothetical protein